MFRSPSRPSRSGRGDSFEPDGHNNRWGSRAALSTARHSWCVCAPPPPNYLDDIVQSCNPEVQQMPPRRSLPSVSRQRGKLRRGGEGVVLQSREAEIARRPECRSSAIWWSMSDCALEPRGAGPSRPGSGPALAVRRMSGLSSPSQSQTASRSSRGIPASTAPSGSGHTARTWPCCTQRARQTRSSIPIAGVTRAIEAQQGARPIHQVFRAASPESARIKLALGLRKWT